MNNHADFDFLTQLEDVKNKELIAIYNKTANNIQGSNKNKVSDNSGIDSSESEE